MTARKRKWLVRLVMLALATATAVGVWTWYDSPARKVRNLMDRLYEEEPSTVQRFTNWIGITKPHKALPGSVVAAEILLVGRPAVPALIEATKDPRPATRQAAASSLSCLAEGPELGHVLALLRDEDEDIRGWAADILAGVRYEPAVEPLIGMIKKKDADGKDEPWWPAAYALLVIGDRRAAGPLIWCFKHSLAKDGGNIGDGSTIWLMLGDYWRIPPLGRMGGPEMRAFFVECLKDNNENIRYAGAKGLGQTRDPEAAGPLIEALGDNWDVRGAAVVSLGLIGNSQAKEPLARRLADEHYQVGLDAAVSLYQLGDGRGRDALVAALRSSETAVRESATMKLADLGDEAALEPLLRMMQYGDKFEGQKAAVALGTLGDPRAFDALVKGLGDDHWVKPSCVQALARLGDERAVGHLLKMLGDPDEDARRATVIALGDMGDQRAAGPLIRLLKDEKVVARHIAEALGKLRTKEAIGPLRRKLREVEKVEEKQPTGEDVCAFAQAIRAIEDNKPPPPRPTPRPRRAVTQPAGGGS